jgi:hypothetical protein
VDARLSSPDHRRWLRDLQNDGFSPDGFVRIEKRRLTSDQAFKFERELIAFYCEKGALLFNKEKGWSGPVRRYENKWMPDPKFGKMPRRCQPPTHAAGGGLVPLFLRPTTHSKCREGFAAALFMGQLPTRE